MARSENSLIGQLLAGRYRVTKELGAGGMGEVYLAEDANLNGCEVVVKAPLAHLMSDRTIRERFLDEVRNLSLHKHQNIVKIQDFGEHDGRPFCVVEYLEGGSLADRLERRGGRLEPKEILEWLPTIARALDFVHSKGLVHRDVKPANVLFDAMNHAYLSDFGIATQINAAADDRTLREHLTEENSFIGAPGYAPPEAVGRELSPQFDQYSLATLVYYALAGRLPFDGKTWDAILLQKKTQAPRALGKLKGVPQKCVDAVMKGLERDRKDRFPSCADFAAEFERGLARGGPWRLPRWRALAAVGAGGLALWFVIEAIRRVDDHRQLTRTDAVFEAGSTAEEINDALALCERFKGAGGTCKSEWYATETLHAFEPTPFEMDRTEVINREFAAFVEATGHSTDAERIGKSADGGVAMVPGLSWSEPYKGAILKQLLDVPVVHVSAYDAQAYCVWKGGRLPSAEEWEYAARGMDRRIFPWGDEFDEAAAEWREPYGRPLPVGSHPAGATPEDGLLDMAGNVWEWIEDGPEAEPTLKGGSYAETNAANLRAATALVVDSPTYSSSDVGFRCLRDL